MNVSSVFKPLLPAVSKMSLVFEPKTVSRSKIYPEAIFMTNIVRSLEIINRFE